MQPFFAYMLRCCDGSFYVGHTDEQRRFAEHESGAFEGYTAARRPVVLAWSEEFPTREEALAVELQLKGWSRAKKEALIRGDWSSLKALARGPSRSERLKRGSDRSPFDSGPAEGGPYAQGERGLQDPTDQQCERGLDRPTTALGERGLQDPTDQQTSVRPERSGRAAAAESKDER